MAHDFYAQWEGPVDLDNCAREPIHTPGAIQPYGIVLAFTVNGRVWMASEGAAEKLTDAPIRAVGALLKDLFTAESALEILAVVLQDTRPIEVTDSRGRLWVAMVSRGPYQHAVVELEPLDSYSIANTQLREAYTRVRAQTEVEGLCHEIASQTQVITGYDRVMVYRFDSDDHGHVVAEAFADGEEPKFLHQHFPEGDIPAQARRLYLRRPVRLIADTEYTPVRLEPAVDSKGNPLDLSEVGCRSVSPIHCEYLKNIGVRATLTLSIIRSGRLWGLVACHHNTPRYLGPYARDAAAFLADVFTHQLVSMLDAAYRSAVARTTERLANSEAEIGGAPSVEQGVLSELPVICEEMDADGAVFLQVSGFVSYGHVPSIDVARTIGVWAAEKAEDNLFHTDRVPKEIPGLEQLTGAGCGVVVIGTPGTPSQLPQLLIFRDERRQDRLWGAKPRHVVMRDARPRLTPQGSMEAYMSEVLQQSRAWEISALGAARVLSNVLERVHARHATRLRDEHVALLESSRAKDAFLAALSHELRNPLNSMMGWSTLLIRGQVPPDRVQGALEAIHRNAKAQQRLIDDLLDVTRIANGKLALRTELMNLEDVVRSAADVTSTLFSEKSVRLDVRIDSHTGPIEGDAQRVEQIFWNLMSNAARYTPSGGHVVVRLYAKASNMVFEVEDDGIGIEPDKCEQIFDRFHQIGDGMAQGGLGLGLSIVKGLADLHNAKVEAYSAGLGLGSRFRVIFPVAVRSGSTPPEPDQEVRRSGQLVGRSVVIVDDDADALQFLEALLAGAGATVLAYSDPRDVLAMLLRDEPPAVDLVISDINMGASDGYALASALRDHPATRDLPLVAVTAYADKTDRVRAFRAGFRAHVSKPVDTDELLALSASLVRRS